MYFMLFMVNSNAGFGMKNALKFLARNRVRIYCSHRFDVDCHP